MDTRTAAGPFKPSARGQKQRNKEELESERAFKMAAQGEGGYESDESTKSTDTLGSEKTKVEEERWEKGKQSSCFAECSTRLREGGSTSVNVSITTIG